MAQTTSQKGNKKLSGKITAQKKIYPLKHKSGRKVPGFIPPMLAKETRDAFDDKEWIFEIKWDGYRAIADLSKTNLRFYSRNGNSFEFVYPEITEALKKLN